MTLLNPRDHVPTFRCQQSSVIRWQIVSSGFVWRRRSAHDRIHTSAGRWLNWPPNGCQNGATNLGKRWTLHFDRL